MNSYMDRYGGGITSVSALIPMIPMDAAGLVAGSTRYPVARFLVYLSLGKILMTATVIYFAIRAFDWAEQYLKWLIQ
jgi:uncharacterized membrane protein YdjX (TVP38/TMEM64 family)